jgi:hypothetical protein
MQLNSASHPSYQQRFTLRSNRVVFRHVVGVSTHVVPCVFHLSADNQMVGLKLDTD